MKWRCYLPTIMTTPYRSNVRQELQRGGIISFTHVTVSLIRNGESYGLGRPQAVWSAKFLSSRHDLSTAVIGWTTMIVDSSGRTNTDDLLLG